MNLQKILFQCSWNIRVLTFLFLLSLRGMSQNSAKDFKRWSHIDTLTYIDFKDTRVDHGRSALSKINLNFYLNEDCEYEVMPTFSRLESFFDSRTRNSKRSLALLKHEQIHFDIMELVARKFRKELDEDLIGCSSELYFNDRLNFYLKMFNQISKKYDKETNHSVNKENQKKWNRYIEIELNKLSNYMMTR